MPEPTGPRRRAPRTAALLLMIFLLAPAGVARAAGLFSDGFESGNLSAWTATAGFVVQGTYVHSGSWGGEAASTGGAAWVSETLSSPQSDLYFDTWFNLRTVGGTTTILRLRPSGTGNILSLKVKNTGPLVLTNNVTGVSKTSATIVGTDAWHEAQVHAQIGTSGLAEVWLDGTKINDLSGADNLGTTSVSRVQLGLNATTTFSWDVAFDDATADTSFIGGGGCTNPPAPTNLHTTSVASNEVDLAWDASAGATGYKVYRTPPGSVVGTPAPTAFSDTTVAASTHYDYQVTATSGSCESGFSDTLGVDTPPGGGGGDPVIAAAGDIACDPANTNYNNGNGTLTKCRQKYTAALLTGADAVLPLGDTQYECGGLSAFNQVYDPTWGANKSISYPAVGNHEYQTSGGTDCGTKASGYFTYFGSAADPLSDGGYYSYNIGSWHLIALNSECNKVSCSNGSAQETWLENDLAANTQPCVLAYWHRPRFASNGSSPQANFYQFWADLYAARADIVLNGHAHFYERFAMQDQDGTAQADGVREFIVGTGGNSHGGLKTPYAANHEVGNSQTFGVLRLTLHASSYDFTFVPEAGKTFTDSGTSVACH